MATETKIKRLTIRIRRYAAHLMTRRLVLATAAVAFLIGGIAAGLARSNGGSTGGERVGARSEAPSTTPTGAVAGSPSTPEQQPSAEVAATVVRLTFDELELDAPIGAGWLVYGEATSVGIAAYPTAVNRSLRLRGLGSNTAACRDLSPEVGAFTVDLRFMVDPESPQARITIAFDGATMDFRASGDSEQDSTGESLKFPGIAAETWYRARVEVTEGAAMARLSAGETGPSVSVANVERSDGAAIQRICFSIPNGDPVELYLDELVTYS